MKQEWNMYKLSFNEKKSSYQQENKVIVGELIYGRWSVASGSHGNGLCGSVDSERWLKMQQNKKNG